ISVLGNSNNTNTSLFNFSGGGNRGATSIMRSGMAVMSNMGGMGAMSNYDASAFSGSSNNGISTTNSFGFNYRDQWSKRISVYGSYSYNHKNTSQLQTTSSQNFFDTSSFVNNQDINNLTKGNSHRFTFNMEYQVDSFNYLKISPSIHFSGSNGNNFNAFDYKKFDSTKTTDGSNRNINSSQAPNFAINLLYNHKFRKRGRNFSASISLGTSNNNSDQDITNLSYQYVPPFVGPRNIFQYIDQENSNHNYGVRFTYSEPLNKYQSIDLTYSHNLNYSRNNRNTYNVDSATQAKTLNSILSNDYENEFYNNRIGLSLRTTKKKYNYTIGLSLQPVNLQGNSITKDSAYKTIKRANVFPIARFAYHFNRTKTFNLSYNGNATQPSFSQLQPVPDQSNQQNITLGNPNLKPSMNHNLNFSYNNFNIISGKILFTNLTFSTIKNQIVYNNINQGAGRQLSIPQNVNGYYNLLGFYVYSRPYKNRKYVVSVRGSANYNHNINLIDSIRNIGQNWVISQGFNFEYNYKEILELAAGVTYSLNDVHYKNKTSVALSTLKNSSSNAWTFSSNMNLNITKTLVLKYDVDYTINTGLASNVSKNQVIMNCSLEQQLFKKKNGILKLEAFDLFKQNSNINRSVTANQIIDSRTNQLTRYFIATFTYRIQRFAGKSTTPGPGINFRQMRSQRPAF
ncbi:MAG: outer membrane beta-barrel protein, partial [Ferruginibacter sp.]